MASDIDFLAHLRSDSARFRDVLAEANPAARVPTCPEWDADDLLWHLTEVQNFWGLIVRDKLNDSEMVPDPERAEGHEALLRQFDECSTNLIEALDGTPDDVPVWTWFPADQSVGFIRRRQAHEALIHRLDAELVTDSVTDIDVTLATDGVLEVLEWMYGGIPEWASLDANGAIGRVATPDTGAEWFVQIAYWSGHSPNTGKTYEREPALMLVDGGDTTFSVSGPAADLDCWMWNRPTRTDITLDGEVSVFVDVIRSGVQ